MASTCDFYKHGIKLGSGTCAGGSASVTSYTANLSRTCARKNIQIVVTQAGVYQGLKWNARVISEGSTCVLSEKCPYTNA